MHICRRYGHHECSVENSAILVIYGDMQNPSFPNCVFVQTHEKHTGSLCSVNCDSLEKAYETEIYSDFLP